MNKKLVVVVEDDRAIREVLTELLESEGYTVMGIGDGPSALQRIQGIHNHVSPVAAITLDLTLPGKDGATILKELKAHPRLRSVPVVVISANMPILSPETRPLAAAIIRKPFDVMHLLDTVSNVVGLPAGARWLSPPTTSPLRHLPRDQSRYKMRA